MQNKKNSNLQPNLFYGKGPKPGEFPYTSGIYPDMYQGKLWTMRQYAGFTSAEESNKRYRYLLEQGVMGLSVAFDLPTQTGYDSDHTLATAEVGRVGVPICTLADMEVLLQDIPLAEVSISMTINSTAAILLAFLVVSAEKQGVDRKQLRGTVQNDILKEYIARGTYIFPPKPSMRIITDLFEFCSKEMPLWNTISISGYHIREAGSTAAQEIAFTLANGIAYVQAALDNGLDVNQFGKRLSFFFNCHNNFFEEVAKFRAARRMWAIIMRDRFGATEPKAMMCRFHTQTAGSTLQAQQIENNVVRTTLQAAAAVLGGTQSLHTNSRDEALALPTEKSARLALRTQQVIAYESGIPEVADPLAGSHYVEALTDKLESEAAAIIEKIDTLGGAVSAIENEFQQNEIAKSAYDYQKAIDEGEKIIVGVNKFETKEVDIPETQGIDEKAVTLQLNRLQSVKQSRNSKKVKLALNALESAAEENINLIPKIIEAVKYEATLGEISDTLRGVFGEF
ncbi:MAG: methylmalonyl-CoA mutase family protein [Candidatus Marinimicrobia bacterium]|nr:methylmalonyl-CoA mutase family protein [Candidatus Neomarinimicrobiota bacterium]